MVRTRRMVQLGDDRVQISRWRADASIASLVPFTTQGMPVGTSVIEQAIAKAQELGFDEAYTAALAPSHIAPFAELGFELLEELHLLRCTLDNEPPAGERSATRKGRRTDWAQVLDLDQLAFDDFWRFDELGLTDAMRATPRFRFQVTRGEPVAGYHITGLSSSNGYIQRVAVHPNAHGRGHGTQLLRHAMRWAWRHGAVTMHVNTQLDNHAALGLYTRAGFELAPYRLQVFRRRLD